MNIEILKIQEKNLLKLLEKNREDQRELNVIEFEKKHSVKIGDTIEWIDGRKSVKGIIIKYDYSGTSVSYMVCRLFNSNGELGKRESRVWSYALDTMKVIEKKQPF